MNKADRWKPIVIAIIAVCLVGIVVMYFSKQPAAPLKPNSTPTTSPESELTRAARGVVGFDDGGIAPNSIDPRVKRAEIALSAISSEFNEPPINVSFGADLSVKFVEEAYNKKITRLQVLEDFWKFHSTADEKTKANAKSQPIKDAIRLYALFKYQ